MGSLLVSPHFWKARIDPRDGHEDRRKIRFHVSIKVRIKMQILANGMLRGSLQPTALS